MPFADGVFTRVNNSFSDPVEGTVIDPTDAIGLWDDYDSGLTQAAAGVFNVKAFGATGDGVTDDILAIQAAVDAAEDQDGGMVYFPAGHYIISAPIDLDDTFTIRLKGDTGQASTGFLSTVITYSGSSAAVTA